MNKKIISADKAPAAIGPYSQGVMADNLLFVSGQLPVDPITGIMPDGIKEQTRQALENVKSVMEAAGGTLENVVKCTVFLKSMNDFADMNKVYGEYFVRNFPARAAIEAARLPKDALVEIEAIAVL